MAVKINEVTITPTTATVGQTITITISAVDVSWKVIKEEFESWTDIKNELSSWNSVLNYH